MPSAVFTAQKWEGTSLGFPCRGRKASWASFPIGDPVFFPSPCSCSSGWVAKQSWREQRLQLLRAEEQNPPLSHACDFQHASPHSDSILRLWKPLLKHCKVPSRHGCLFPDILTSWEWVKAWYAVCAIKMGRVVPTVPFLWQPGGCLQTQGGFSTLVLLPGSM